MRRRSLALALAALLGPLPLLAQTVRGTLVDPATQLGIPGARILLMDANGRAVASARTGAGGGFELASPVGGRFTLRAERPGFLATTSEPLVVGVGETVRHRLVATERPVLLEGITAEAGSRCQVRPGEGEQVAVVWDEARKALDAARDALATAAYRYRVRAYSRQVDPLTNVVLVDSARGAEVFTERPFVPVSVETLARRGFVRERGDTVVYDVPDADVLLSDFFLDEHCFRLLPPEPQREGLIGLAFEPVRTREVPDVQGVLWLSRSPVELRTVEFEYTRAPLRGPRGVPGGSIHFRALPNGSWIVSRWRLRMPVRRPEQQGLEVVAAHLVSKPPVLREQGGEVTAIFTADGREVATEVGATLTGTVWDSTTARPLAGAEVFLNGTSYSTTTDSAGEYVLRFLPEGSFTVGYTAPRLSLLGWVPPEPPPVTLARGKVARQDLAVPSLARVLASRCEAGDAASAALVGLVRDGNGAPVAGAQVQASWMTGTSRLGRNAQSDSAGLYRLCGVPAGVTVTVSAAGQGAVARAAEVRLAAGEPLQRDLSLGGRRRTLPALRERTLAVRVVRAGNGAPLEGVKLRLAPAGREAFTDADGVATFADLSPMRYTVEVQHPEGGSYTQPVMVRAGGESVELLVRRRGETVALAPLVAVGRSLSQQAARERGARQMVVTREEIAAVENSKRHVGDLIRGRFAGVSVTEYVDSHGRTHLCVGSGRGPTSMRTAPQICNEARIVLDGIPLAEGSEFIVRLSLHEIESVEFLNSIDSALRFGTGTSGQSTSTLVIWTRGMGPYARRTSDEQDDAAGEETAPADSAAAQRRPR